MAQAQMRRTLPLYPAEEDSKPNVGGRYINVGRAERAASVAVGGVMAVAGLRRGSVAGLLAAAAGGVLLFRGLSGHCPLLGALGVDTASPDQQDPTVEIVESLAVYSPREQVYACWRDLEGLPRFMHHLASVEVLGPQRSRWTARVPRGLGDIAWEAELIEDVPGERLTWRSLPGADVYNAGTVRFEDAPGGHGTVVHASITYRPPAGDLGAAAARLLNPALSQMIKEDIRRFRSFVETGEVPTTEGQPAGGDRRSDAASAPLSEPGAA